MAGGIPTRAELLRCGEDPGGEGRFVVGANRLGSAVMFDGIQQQWKNGD